MTAPFEIEIEDDRVIAIENSHLSRGRCGCGSDVVFDATVPQKPTCGSCRLTLAEMATEPAPVTGLPSLGQGFPPHAPLAGAPFPAPRVTSRDCWDRTDAPSAVEKLAQRAREAGWRVKAQRSEGHTPHAATGRPSAARKTLYALRLAKGGAAAYAVRDGDQWSSVMLWGAETPWFSLGSVTDLDQYLAADGRMPPEWYDAIRARVAASEARKKARLGCDKGLHPSGEISTSDGVQACGLCGNSWPVGGEVWVKPKRGKSEAN